MGGEGGGGMVVGGGGVAGVKLLSEISRQNLRETR